MVEPFTPTGSKVEIVFVSGVTSQKDLEQLPDIAQKKCICSNLNQVMRRKGVSSKIYCQFLSTNSALNVLSNIFPKRITCSICIIVIAFVLLLSRCQGSKHQRNTIQTSWISTIIILSPSLKALFFT